MALVDVGVVEEGGWGEEGTDAEEGVGEGWDCEGEGEEGLISLAMAHRIRATYVGSVRYLESVHVGNLMR